MRSSSRSPAEQIDPDKSARTPVARHQLPARTGWFRRILSDLFFVANRDKKWLLLPLILVLLILTALLALATLAGPLAPFIYPIL